jgi:hypothetical protein
MRAGSRLPGLLALLTLLIVPIGRASAAGLGKVSIEELGLRVRTLLPFLGSAADAVLPQQLEQADQDGPAVDPSRLGDPTKIEQELRASLREPLGDTRLTVAGGTARLGHYSLGSAERFTGHLVVLKGDAEIHGHLEGNIVTLDGDITIHPGASVEGDVLAIGGRVRDISGGITGTHAEIEANFGPVGPSASPIQLIGRRSAGLLGVFLTMLVLGIGLVTFGRPNLEIVSDTVTNSFGRAFLAGVLGEILVLPTFGMLLVGLFLTIAGALLVPFAAVVYTLFAIFAVLGGVLAVSHAMGERITRRRMAHGVVVSPNSYRYMITGLGAIAASWIAWVVFGWVPVAGTIAFLVAALGSWFVATVGFGAALLSRGGIREEFTGRLLPPAMMTDEYLWATPLVGVPAVKRPPKDS